LAASPSRRNEKKKGKKKPTLKTADLYRRPKRILDEGRRPASVLERGITLLGEPSQLCCGVLKEGDAGGI